MKDKKVQYFVLNTGARIPAVGLGTWQTGGDVCKAAVRTALEVGYRHLDCAHLYGNEVEVGQALAEALGGSMPGLQRQDLFVTSKFLCTTNAPKRVVSAVEVSLKNLALSYLDLYLIHWPVNAHVGDATDPPYKQGKPSPRIKEAWRSMESLVEKGLVRAIGVSNFSISQVQELLIFAKIIPAVNQVELHPFWRQDELVKFCQSKGIHVSAHTPLGIPGSSLKSLGDDVLGGEHELMSPGHPIVFTRSRSGHAPMLKMSAVEVIGERLHKTSAQVILRWGIQRGTSVLPRSLHPDRIRSNFDILSWSLSDEDWDEINSMGPQLPLIDSGNTLLSVNGPLQAVKEIDDNDPNMTKRRKLSHKIYDMLGTYDLMIEKTSCIFNLVEENLMDVDSKQSAGANVLFNVSNGFVPNMVGKRGCLDDQARKPIAVAAKRSRQSEHLST